LGTVTFPLTKVTVDSATSRSGYALTMTDDTTPNVPTFKVTVYFRRGLRLTHLDLVKRKTDP
jgi:hypothetical protein